MFSPNQLYDYLRYYCYTNKKNVTVRNFIKHGSKCFEDLSQLSTFSSIYIPPIIENNDYSSNFGVMEMFEQEPLDIHAFYNASYENNKKHTPTSFRFLLNQNDYVFAKSATLYSPILAHSEVDSNDVREYKDNHFIPMYFWANAITSRYWFLHYELLQKDNVTSPKRFGVYIRDTSGTRTYRKNILDFVKLHILEKCYCPILHEGEIVSSDMSASIDWTDHTKFDIHIVPETIFNTEKVHLTEKIFKPIVMYQPFILFAGPKSLKYLRNYGFKTFSDVWDESYDLEYDSEIRYNKVIELIKNISQMNTHDYNRLIEKTKNIVNFNRKHFYSEKFKNTLLNELHNNMKTAMTLQEESFFNNPGGPLFHYYDLAYKSDKAKFGNAHFPIPMDNAIRYANFKSNDVGDKIIKKYNHLLQAIH